MHQSNYVTVSLGKSPPICVINIFHQRNTIKEKILIHSECTSESTWKKKSRKGLLVSSNIDKFLKRNNTFYFIITVVAPYSNVKARKTLLPVGYRRGSEHASCADVDAELRDLSPAISSGPALLQQSHTQRCHPPFLPRVKGSTTVLQCQRQYL